MGHFVSIVGIVDISIDVDRHFDKTFFCWWILDSAFETLILLTRRLEKVTHHCKISSCCAMSWKCSKKTSQREMFQWFH